MAHQHECRFCRTFYTCPQECGKGICERCREHLRALTASQQWFAEMFADRLAALEAEQESKITKD